jgi:MFS-type transporter involved in bile tolerance (Atg22 family)
MSSIFLGPALLQLATEAANCESEQDCDARVMGMKPSSLLTNIAVATGLVTAVTMPIIGAVVDHTPYRLQVGTYSAYVLSAIKAIEVMVSPATWFYVACLQVLSGFVYYVHIVVTYAYTSELSKNSTEQTKYNSFFFVVLYASTLIFMLKILTLSFVFDQDDVGTARMSQIITSLFSACFFVFAWSSLFQDRPPSATLQEGQSLWTVGFVKVCKTSGEIYRTMPALKLLMGSVLFAESAMTTLITVATTVMSTFLDMTSTEIGVVFLVVLIMGIPGVKIGEWLALKFNPLFSAKVCIILFILSTTSASIVLTGPEHKQYTFIFGTMWGIGLGWLHPMHTILFLGLTPDHARTEFMGIFIFSQQILAWLPPLVFTILNEVGVPMTIGLASLNVFFAIGLCCLQSMGRYDVLQSMPTSELTVELPAIS